MFMYGSLMSLASPLLSPSGQRVVSSPRIRHDGGCFLGSRSIPSYFGAIFVLALHGYPSYVFVYNICIGSIEENLDLGWNYFRLIFYIFLSLFMHWSYWMCVFTSPGFASPVVNADIQQVSAALDRGHPIQVTNSDGITFSPVAIDSRNSWIRPERAHYSRIFDKLILRMDHYCPWVCNIVGFWNHRFFVQFVLYASLTGIFGGVFSIPELVQTLQGRRELRPFSAQTAIAFFWMIFFGIVLFVFFYTVLEQLSTNVTTLESMQGTFNYLWNMGWKENFRQILGDSVWMWFIPLRFELPVDGYNWPRSDGTVGPSFQPSNWPRVEFTPTSASFPSPPSTIPTQMAFLSSSVNPLKDIDV